MAAESCCWACVIIHWAIVPAVRSFSQPSVCPTMPYLAPLPCGEQPPFATPVWTSSRDSPGLNHLLLDGTDPTDRAILLGNLNLIVARREPTVLFRPISLVLFINLLVYRHSGYEVAGSEGRYQGHIGLDGVWGTSETLLLSSPAPVQELACETFAVDKAKSRHRCIESVAQLPPHVTQISCFLHLDPRCTCNINPEPCHPGQAGRSI